MIKVKAEFPILRVVCPTTIVKRIMVVEEMPKVKKFIKRNDTKDSKRVVYYGLPFLEFESIFTVTFIRHVTSEKFTMYLMMYDKKI